MSNLSEYEKKRLENIKANEAIFKDLAIPQLIRPKKRVAIEPMKKKTTKRVNEGPRRVSSRLLGKAPEETIELEVAETQAPKTLDRLESSDHQAIQTLFQSAPTDPQPPLAAWEAALEDMEIRHRWSTVKVTPSRISSAIFHPSTRSLMGCAVDVEGHVGFWDIGSSIESSEEKEPKVYQYRPHTRTVTDIRIDRDQGQRIWTCSYDGKIRWFDCEQASWSTVDLQGDYGLTSLAIDGATIWFSTSDGELGQVDTRSGQAPTIHSIREKKVGCIDFRQGLIAAGSNDRTLTVWDVRRMRKQSPLVVEEHGYAVTSCYWSPRGDQIATSCYDDQIRVLSWTRSRTLTMAHQIHHNHHTGRWVTNLRARWHPTQPALVIGNMKQTVDIYSTQTGQALNRLYDPDHVTAIPSVVQFHPTLAQPTLLTGNASGRMLCWQSKD